MKALHRQRTTRTPGALRALFWPDHATLNGRAGVLHLLLVLVILVMWGVKDPPFYLEFNKMWAAPTVIPIALQSTTCNGTDGVLRDYQDLGVWNWLACVRDGTNATRGEFDPYTPTKVTGLGRIKVVWLLLVFEVLTSAVHFWMWALDRWWDGLYTQRLNDQLQPWRWFEYSITASLMMWCALSLSRVQDQFLLLSLFVNSFYLNFVGGGLFEVCGWAARHASGDLRRMFLRAKWTAFVSAWFAYGIAIWTSWDAMGAVVQPYLNLESGALWGEMFDVVVWVNLGITITYGIFPLIHIYVFDPLGLLAWWHERSHGGKARDPKEVYLRGEKLYIYGSFVAKTTLVATIAVAAWMRNNN